MDIKAAERFSKIYDELIKNNIDIDNKSLNLFLIRIIFCLFAEDTEMFEKGSFTNDLKTLTSRDGSDFNDVIALIFEKLSKLDMNVKYEYLKKYPYVNGNLFSEEHKKIVDAYNSVNPKPVGYTAKYSDDWCDIFVTTVFQQAGLSHLIGRECGVQRHIGILEQKGIWKGKTQPKVGDIVTFDWDGGGWADHIGIVESVNNGVITTIEGNSAQYAGDTAPTKVNRKTYNWDSRYIKGYARPMY